jgi:hypothetical protein
MDVNKKTTILMGGFDFQRIRKKAPSTIPPIGIKNIIKQITKRSLIILIMKLPVSNHCFIDSCVSGNTMEINGGIIPRNIPIIIMPIYDST